MTPEEIVEEALAWISMASAPAPGVRKEDVIATIRRVRLVVGVEVQPRRDPRGRTEELLSKLCYGLRPLLFFEDAVYDWESNLLLRPQTLGDGLTKVADIEAL